MFLRYFANSKHTQRSFLLWQNHQFCSSKPGYKESFVKQNEDEELNKKFMKNIEFSEKHIEKIVDNFNLNQVGSSIKIKISNDSAKLQNSADSLAPDPELMNSSKSYRLLSRIFKDIELIRKVYIYVGEYIFPIKKTSPKIKKLMIKSYLYLILSRIFLFSLPFCMKYGIDNLSNPALCYYSIGAFGIWGIINTLQNYSEGKRQTYVNLIAQAAWGDLALKTYDHLLRMDIYHHQQGTRRTLFAIRNAKKGIDRMIKISSQHFIPTVAELTVASCLLFIHFGPQYFIIFITTTFLYGKFTKSASLSRKNYLAKQKVLDKLTDFMVGEALSNIRLIKSFNTQEIEMKKFQKSLNGLHYFSNLNYRSLHKLNLGQRAVFSVGMATNLILAAINVSKGSMTIGDIVLLQSLMNQAFGPLNFLGTLYREWIDSYYEVSDLFELLKIEPEIKDAPNATDLVVTDGNIEFKNVSFNYPKGGKILTNLNLKIGGKKFILITGESGIGKSTIFSLLYRFF